MNIFEKAKGIVDGNRYGSAENNFEIISGLWSIYVGKAITAEDVANMMMLLKIARNKSGHGKEDNYVDICGYAYFGNKFVEELTAYFEKVSEENKGNEMKVKIYKPHEFSEDEKIECERCNHCACCDEDSDCFVPEFKNTKGAKELMKIRKSRSGYCSVCRYMESEEPCNDCRHIRFGVMDNWKDKK